jgi:hypothetical protein
MASYTVIALSLGGLRNKVYSSGDVVTQEQLPVDTSELVAKGFLKPVDAPVTVKSVAANVEPSVIESIMLANAPKVWPPIEDMTAKEIKEALGDKAPKVFTPKADLYALLVG